jgi:hypothetical protein
MRYDLSIRNGRPLRLCFGGFCDPLPNLGLGLGGPWVGPRATHGPPKRHARETQASIWGNVFVCNKNKKMAGWGPSMIAKIAEIAKSKTRTFNHKGHEGTRRRDCGSQACATGSSQARRLRSTKAQGPQTWLLRQPSRKSGSTGMRDTTHRQLSS